MIPYSDFVESLNQIIVKLIIVPEDQKESDCGKSYALDTTHVWDEIEYSVAFALDWVLA